MSLAERLQEIPFFKNFGHEEVKSLAGIMEEKEYTDKDIIFNEKTTCSILFFILKGKVNIYKMMYGSANFLTILDTNDLFGEVSFIDAKARSASASAMGDVKVAMLRLEKFDSFVDTHSKLGIKFLFELMQELCRKFRAVNEGLDLKSPEQSIYELINNATLVKITTTETEYMCAIIYADKNPTQPMLKLDVKGTPILLPMSQIKAITLPNKFGKFA